MLRPAMVAPTTRRGACRMSASLALLPLLMLVGIIVADKLPAYRSFTSRRGQGWTGDGSAPPSRTANPAVVEWTTSPASQLKLIPSSYQCTEEEPLHQTCIFENVAMYRGELTFLAADKKAAKSIALPDPNIFEVGNSPTNDFQLQGIMRVMTAQDLAAEIEAANRGRELRLAQFQTAIFQRTRTFNNWFWALNGAGNAYHRLCKYFGACSGAEVRAAALLQPIIQSSPNLSDVGYLGLPLHHAFSALDLMDCFGPLLWVNHPSGREVEERPPAEVFLFQRMLVGIGQDVVQPKAALSAEDEVQYQQANASMSLQRVRFLRQCAGLPPDPRPRSRPSILLINRPYADGRSILGLDDVYDRLRRALPAAVPVHIYLPRGEVGLHDQASMFDAATVVVSPHGAATANFNFMPHDAVALGVFALKGRFGHDEAVGAAMPAPPYNMTVLPVDCTKSTETMTNFVAALPEYQALSPAEREELLVEHEMGAAFGKRVRQLLGISLLDWMGFRAYHPDPLELTTMVLGAVDLWQEKVAARAVFGF